MKTKLINEGAVSRVPKKSEQAMYLWALKKFNDLINGYITGPNSPVKFQNPVKGKWVVEIKFEDKIFAYQIDELPKEDYVHFIKALVKFNDALTDIILNQTRYKGYKEYSAAIDSKTKELLLTVNNKGLKPGTEEIIIGNEYYDPKQVRELLAGLTDRIYMDEIPPGLGRFMNKTLGLTRRGMSLQEFRDIYTGGGLKLGFAGPTNPAKINSQSQSKAVKTIIEGLNNWTDAIVHGGTMWAFIKDAHLQAVKNNKLSIGIMPWKGIEDLLHLQAQGAFSKDFPKMDYLAIAGENYTDHVNIFGHTVDMLCLLGGRSGSLSEALATSRLNKPVVSLYLNPDDEVFKVFNNGIWYTEDPNEVVEFTKNNLLPDQRLFKGTHISWHRFMKETHDKLRLGFAGNSGRKTDVGRHKLILSSLMLNTNPKYHDLLENVSGMTAIGGVKSFYEVSNEMNISSSGIMSSKGIGYKLANTQRMIVWGSEWGSESEVFLQSIDILLILGGGGQTATEAALALSKGGRRGNGIPVLAIVDPLVGNWSFNSYNKINGAQRLPGIEYFLSSDLHKASKRLNTLFEDHLNEREAMVIR
ncbi:MAG: hypothetical protein PHV30_04265 [Candidatus Margulisbacteria bacterium]|nr:hypothetical protein [Candidatus Margulisiibacteriota bacterium]